jgi:hypothetical protein
MIAGDGQKRGSAEPFVPADLTRAWSGAAVESWIDESRWLADTMLDLQT